MLSLKRFIGIGVFDTGILLHQRRDNLIIWFDCTVDKIAIKNKMFAMIKWVQIPHHVRHIILLMSKIQIKLFTTTWTF